MWTEILLKLELAKGQIRKGITVTSAPRQDGLFCSLCTLTATLLRFLVLYWCVSQHKTDTDYTVWTNWCNFILYSHSKRSDLRNKSELGAIYTKHSEWNNDIFLCLKCSFCLTYCNENMSSVWTKCLVQRMPSSPLHVPFALSPDLVLWFSRQGKIFLKHPLCCLK